MTFNDCKVIPWIISQSFPPSSQSTTSKLLLKYLRMAAPRVPNHQPMHLVLLVVCVYPSSLLLHSLYDVSLYAASFGSLYHRYLRDL